MVEVVDPRGVPFSGVKVTLQGQTVPQTTDSNGTVIFPQVTGAQATVVVQVAGFTMKKTGPTDETMFVVMPVAAPVPLVTIVELAALALGGIAVATGILMKRQIISTLGEIALGAGAFNIVFRHSCK